MIEEDIVKNIVRQFCCAWFEERNFVDTAKFLAEDIGFIGQVFLKSLEEKWLWRNISERILNRYRNRFI